MRLRSHLVLAGVLALLAGGCSSQGKSGSVHAGGVPELKNISQLRAAFNAHPGQPRLIALVSPTCPTCILGSSWIRQHILNAHRTAKLHVLVVWEPMYPGDSYASINHKMFNDPRVTSFWDPHEISGTWFDTHAAGGPQGRKIWDAYYAYKPTARWTDAPTDLIANGQTIIGSTDELQRRFLPLLH